MRTEKEIKELIATLKLLVVQPCDCLSRGMVHSFKCAAGEAAMNSAIKNLEWTLGDVTHQSAVNLMNEGAAKIRTENRKAVEERQKRKRES